MNRALGETKMLAACGLWITYCGWKSFQAPFHEYFVVAFINSMYTIQCWLRTFTSPVRTGSTSRGWWNTWSVLWRWRMMAILWKTFHHLDLGDFVFFCRRILICGRAHLRPDKKFKVNYSWRTCNLPTHNNTPKQIANQVLDGLWRREGIIHMYLTRKTCL